MDVWQERDRFRQRTKKAYKRHSQKLMDTLGRAKQQMTFEAQYIQKCSERFDEFQEDFRKIYLKQKAINQLFRLLPKDSGSIEINDIHREAEKLQIQFMQAGFAAVKLYKWDMSANKIKRQYQYLLGGFCCFFQV